NSDKLTLEEAKKKFVTLLKSDPTGFYNVNQVFFGQFSYNGLPISSDVILRNACNDSNFWKNSLFNFVSIVP
ncbi:hypothetical protein, partial [Cellulophaga sp. BC115SP]|uniref:hypothetical protein n=1 Tax=Cellulophaga sp. BC115SP TaxID=2683263 RepID=UPI00196AE69C